MTSEKKFYIELNTFLNIKGIATSGGNAKYIIRNEEIKVNDKIETRNKNKLFPGYKVQYKNQILEVKKEDCQKEYIKK